MDAKINRYLLLPLKIIDHPDGNILHSLKSSSESFIRFGEAYFSFINHGAIKGWKKHNKVTLNICVPIGAIRFIIHSGEKLENGLVDADEIVLDRSNYNILSIPPGSWVAFQGLGKQTNMLLNIIDYEHDPNESDNKSLDSYPYNW